MKVCYSHLEKILYYRKRAEQSAFNEAMNKCSSEVCSCNCVLRAGREFETDMPCQKKKKVKRMYCTLQCMIRFPPPTSTVFALCLLSYQVCNNHSHLDYVHMCICRQYLDRLSLIQYWWIRIYTVHSFMLGKLGTKLARKQWMFTV